MADEKNRKGDLSKTRQDKTDSGVQFSAQDSSQYFKPDYYLPGIRRSA